MPLMMPDNYLYNSKGEYIAFKIGNYIFNNKNAWIGWLPWSNNEIVNKEGEYIGTILNDRIYSFSRRNITEHPGYISFPGHPGYIKDPGFGGCTSLPPFASDVELDQIMD